MFNYQFMTNGCGVDFRNKLLICVYCIITETCILFTKTQYMQSLTNEANYNNIPVKPRVDNVRLDHS